MRAVAGGGRVAVLAGAAAEVGGDVAVAGAADIAAGIADPHDAHRQVSSRQPTKMRGFAPILTGCRGLTFRRKSPDLPVNDLVLGWQPGVQVEGRDAMAQARGLILAASRRRLDSELHAAIEQARLALDALGEVEAWCAAAISDP